jgi:pimeloyl-[acyl-carrier protein] methyl ester esterase
MSFLETEEGLRLHYEDGGSGPPLLFIHGWTMSGRVWRFQTEALLPHYRPVTLDLRGHGLSSPAAAYTLDLLAADVASLARFLDLRGACLVGWSLGAQVALRSFPLLRERIAGLVLVGGTPRFTAGDGYPHGLPPREVRGMAARLSRDFPRTLGEFFRAMFAPGELGREEENRIAREIVMGGRVPEPAVALATLATLAETDLRGELPGVDRPVLLIHGGADPICLPAASRAMAELLPDARLAELSGLGHAPFLSRPSLFTELLRGFLKELHEGR